MPAETKENQVPSLKRKSFDNLIESAKLYKDSEQSLTEIRDAQAFVPHSSPHQNSIEIEMIQNSSKVKQITEKMIEEEIIPRNKDRPYTKVIQEMNKNKWQKATVLHQEVLKQFGYCEKENYHLAKFAADLLAKIKKTEEEINSLNQKLQNCIEESNNRCCAMGKGADEETKLSTEGTTASQTENSTETTNDGVTLEDWKEICQKSKSMEGFVRAVIAKVFSFEELIHDEKNSKGTQLGKVFKIVDSQVTFENIDLLQRIFEKEKDEIKRNIYAKLTTQITKFKSVAGCGVAASNGEMFFYKHEDSKMVPYSEDMKSMTVSRYIEEFGIPEIHKNEETIFVFRGRQNHSCKEYKLNINENQVKPMNNKYETK